MADQVHPRQSLQVAVIGGGLAGIAAASALVDAGIDVTLIERRKLLGGRATSFQDATTGQLLDNCQHVLLGCCTNLLHLYRRLKVEKSLDFFDRITFADAHGRRSSLGASALPSPLHLAPSMLRFRLLSLGQKIQVAQAMGAMQVMTEQEVRDSDALTFADWLMDHGQTRETMTAFWNVILVSALNEDADHASARYALQVFRQAFLGHRRGYVMGVPSVPLAALYATPVATRVMMGTTVERLDLQPGGRWRITTGANQALNIDAVVIATAPHATTKLVMPFAERDASLRCLDQYTFRPILGVHLFYDRPVLSEPHLALVGTELQWLFRKDADGQHIHGVISAATRQAEEANPDLLARFVAEIEQLLPTARGAKLLSHRIVKEKRATFSPVPNLDRLRPTQATFVPGLFLAGDYTRTDWPATMEGAVRSGYLAAEALLRSRGRDIRFLQPDL